MRCWAIITGVFFGLSFVSHHCEASLLRLKGPRGANGTGRVEVFYNGTWGTICDDGWDLKVAKVVCRQLGYRDAVRTLERDEVPSGSGQIWLSYVSCSGDERNITGCFYDGWGEISCSHHEDAGVECTNTDFTGIPVRVRLQGPSSENGTGRVEVLYHGYWGTICDDGWSMRDASVVCRQLGYQDAGRSLQRNEVPSGTGQIWLSEVSCTGSEQNISSCSHHGWGNHRCSHNEDVGVVCTKTDFTGIPVRVRLQGPSSENGTGRVEVLYHGYWGTISDYGWDMKDAKVVCRQLGYLDVAKMLQRNEVPSGSGQIWLDNVACTGEEQNISSCFHPGWGVSGCDHSLDAGVECSSTEITATPVRLRLQGPLSANGTGRVEVLHHGYWGAICARRWDRKDARVVCRQLGYNPDDAKTFQWNLVAPASGPLWLKNVRCIGDEQNITSCSYDGWGFTSCSSDGVAGVHCYTIDFTGVPVRLRLQGPLSANGTGRVEVLYHGYWGTICDDGWDINNARVICRQLGYRDVVRTLQRNEVPSGSGQIWLSCVNCTGNEQNITNCSHGGWGNHRCSHDKDAGVECTNADLTALPAKLRLQGPSSANGTGRVEIFYNGTWGTICDNEWDMRDARVVCRQLGYIDASRALDGRQVPSGSGKIWLSNVECTGDEQNITQCLHDGWGNHSCSHDEDAGVECLTANFSAIPVRLRLQGPLNASGIGRVEVLFYGQWGAICDHDSRWDMKDAKVVCRQLGYQYVVRTLQRHEVPTNYKRVWLEYIDCTGKEENIESCSLSSWGDRHCSDDEVVGVECATKDVTGIPVELRLKGSLSSNGSGRVEISYRGRWGTICGDGWDMKDARVVCRQLGYQDASEASSSGTLPPRSGPVWLTQVSCTGEERNIANCSHRGWGKVRSCSNLGDAGVQCFWKTEKEKSRGEQERAAEWPIFMIIPAVIIAGIIIASVAIFYPRQRLRRRRNIEPDSKSEHTIKNPVYGELDHVGLKQNYHESGEAADNAGYVTLID
ncbi:scavenger receptor cysteine-rich domain superfamily protein-like [Dendronephthya gigantea]|uniref:scavenger receptor cysteine-rich domain superfamily protein-like n=1 Tax=Dendronephthya gigantea TaxID=151771 RepID=UPI001069B453|nr:scavenger receptor cysteine-rich domain superfamily protein-like [Dendronephthya gigantea]